MDTAAQAIWFAERLEWLGWLHDRAPEVGAARHALIRLEHAHPPEAIDGVAAALRAAMPDVTDVSREAASRWAEVAWRLGFLTLERTLTDDELDRALSVPHELWLRRERGSVEVEDELGEPSFVIGPHLPGRPTACVFCYASTVDRPWVCFDFDGDPARLRSVRRTDRTWDEGGLTLTAWGAAHTRQERVIPPITESSW